MVFTRNFLKILSKAAISPLLSTNLRCFTNNPLIDQLKEEISELQTIKTTPNLSLIDPYTKLAQIYLQENNPDEAIPSLTKAIEILETSQTSPEKLSGTYKALANAYKATRNTDTAISYIQKALEIDLNTYGEYDFNVALNYNNLGALLMEKGQNEEAYDYLIKALPIFAEKGEEETDASMATFYFNIGYVYIQQNMISEGLKSFKISLRNFEIITGPDSASVADLSYHIGMQYEKLGDNASAIEYYKRAINCKHNFSPPEIAGFYSKIGSFYYELRQYQESLNHHKTAIEIAKENNAPKETLGFLHNNIGKTYLATGDIPSAKTHHEESLAIIQSTKGEISNETAEAHDSLSALHHQTRDYPSATQHAQKSLAIRQTLKQISPEYVAVSYINLGCINHAAGKLQEGQSYLYQALNTMKKGHDQGLLIATHKSLSLLLRDKGDFPAAVSHIEQAIELVRNSHREHSELATLHGIYGNILQSSSDDIRAIEVLQEGVRIAEKLENPQSLAGLTESLGNSYRNNEEYAKAIELHAKSLEMILKYLPENDFNVGASYHLLAHDYQLAGEYENALEYQNKGIKVYETVLGTDSPYTAGSKVLQAEIYEKMNKTGEAIELLNNAMETYRKLYGDASVVVKKLQESIAHLSKN